jgi:Immunity protein 26
MAKRGKKQQWSVGDLFLVQLIDGVAVVGQVVGQERQALNSVTCAFFDVRLQNEQDLDRLKAVPKGSLFSALFVTRDLLDNGEWRVVKAMKLQISRKQLPNEQFRKLGWVGATIFGSGNIVDFLNAFYGLAPWDAYKDPEYFDKLLTSPLKRPNHLVLKSAR